MGNRRFVLTTVGISLFLNSAEAEWRAQLNKQSNARDVPAEMKQQIETKAQHILATLKQAEVAEIRRLSAELNGLYCYYENQLTRARDDVHWLIATDTYLGGKAAEIVKDFMEDQQLNCNLFVPPNLSSSEPASFSKGIKELIRWCEETIPAYRESQYSVVFNLTGAFKSLQGYLNIAGMFYADEIVYIFETGQSLLSIPRLPIQVDTNGLRGHRLELALMAQGHVCSNDQVVGIPAGLLDEDQSGALLSDWGLMIWNRSRRDLLGDDLLPFPRLQYTDKFRRDFKQATQQERAELQETLAKVSGILEDHHGDTSFLKQDGGLQYDIYSGKKSEDGRPIGHFRVNQSRRVSCTTEDGALRLRHYGEHSVNDNP